MAERDLTSLIDELLLDRNRQGLLRRRREVRPLDAVHVEIAGRRLVNFASNNYLGLTHHPSVIAAARDAALLAGAGSGASPLISGHSPYHAQAEAAIAAWKQTESAVLMPSGYQANVAAVQTVAAVAAESGRSVRVLIDKLAHASLIDAARSAQLPMRVFPHNGLAKLGRLLADSPADQIQLVLTESIFSMDGDAADLEGLARLKVEHPFVLLLDEAHASGVYGPGGSGLAAEQGLGSTVDVSVITLSKAVGAGGGAICGSRSFCDAVANFGRAAIYSTGITPSAAACARAAIGVMASEPHRQRRVRDLAVRARTRLHEWGRTLPPGDAPIIPIILGDPLAATRAAERLEAEGLLVVAIRPPTVPRQTSRLRITLSSEHSDQEVQHLLDALRPLM
jgi:8-amino-7-oxononanoate synthase